jgi:hypothetical protein
MSPGRAISILASICRGIGLNYFGRRRDRPAQSRAISTIFQLLPIKERAVSAQKLEMAVRFSTSETGATTYSHCAQRPEAAQTVPDAP